ncbi:hypothetical protein [Pinisolibacter sp.]|mgnify:CR=1 FL=1|uniref:hypothetical protein n=1 Tax=Pinisolibacter sp. TaxID=2172024 RepID=UPI002FDCCAFE
MWTPIEIGRAGRRLVAQLLRSSFVGLRTFADRHARRRILVLGDSHVRAFEHWLFLIGMPRTRFDVTFAPGGTALGLHNTESVSGARRRFDAALARGPYDRVIVGLGEVDTAVAIWLVVEKNRQNLETVLNRSVGRYLSFLEQVAADHDLVVLGACMPTVDVYTADGDEVGVSRASIAATRRERTDLALAFDARVAAWCRARAIPHLDSAAAALGPDGFVRPSWTALDSRGRPDHHYARRRFARWILGELRRLPDRDRPARPK